MNYRLVTFLLLVGLISCQAEMLGEKDYLRYLSEHQESLIKAKQLDEVSLSLMYIPKGQVFLNQHQHSAETYEAIAEQHRVYFKLSIDDPLLKNLNKNSDYYRQRLHYLSFGLEKDIAIEYGDYKQSCDIYHFERSYDLKPEHSISFSLPISINNNYWEHDLICLIDSEPLGGIPLRFRFDADFLNTLPKLKPTL